MRAIVNYLLVMSVVLLAFISGFLSYPRLQPLLGLALGPMPLTEQLPNGGADPEDMTLFWEVWHLLDQSFYGDKPDVTQQRYGAVRGLVAAYSDPYTRFEEPVQSIVSQEQFCGCFGGIGASIEEAEAGFILHPLPEQPASHAGVQDGDLLIQVDEEVLTLEMTVDEVVRLVRGEIDSQVKLVVQRTGTGERSNVVELLSFVVRRVEIQTPSLEWRLLDDDPGTAMIGYIRHMQFTANSPDEMRQALTELQSAGAKRYILDLRGNPGGPVDAALQMADMWLDGGLILIEEHANGDQDRFEATRDVIVESAPLVVLVDGGSASASEIVAGALQDHRRAILVGEQTYGKGSVQLRYDLSDKSSLFVTNAQWFTPDYHKIAGMGLTPNVSVEPGTDALAVAITSVQQIAAAE